MVHVLRAGRRDWQGGERLYAGHQDEAALPRQIVARERLRGFRPVSEASRGPPCKELELVIDVCRNWARVSTSFAMTPPRWRKSHRARGCTRVRAVWGAWPGTILRRRPAGQREPDKADCPYWVAPSSRRRPAGLATLGRAYAATANRRECSPPWRFGGLEVRGCTAVIGGLLRSGTDPCGDARERAGRALRMPLFRAGDCATGPR
jgi:hypothetical protein